MLQIFPFLIWLAVVASAVLLAGLWKLGSLTTSAAIVLCVWLLVAACCQFFASSALVGAIGLVFQTLLAIYLIVRWRLSV